MFFDNEPKDYEEIGAEELNRLIEGWGEELFKEERARRQAEAFLSDEGRPGPVPEVTKSRFAFLRNWRSLNSRPGIISVLRSIGLC